MNLAFPYAFDSTGHTEQATSVARHVEDMIELILLTYHGERVNRPTFGSGTGNLCLPQQRCAAAAPAAGDPVGTAAVSVGFDCELGDGRANDATLQVTVVYTLVATSNSSHNNSCMEGQRNDRLLPGQAAPRPAYSPRRF
jgi:hypothetical protein